MISLEWIWVLTLLPLPLLVRLALPPAQSNVQAALHTPFLSELKSIHEAPSHTHKKQGFRSLLPWLIWLALVLAAARPVWIGEPVELPASGRDLMLAVDVSPSMQETDLHINDKPVDRLTALKAVMNPFIDSRVGDRLGLILFGSQAYLQTPLTFDRITVKTLLKESRIGIAGDATAIGDAIGLGLKRLVHRPNEKKVLILITDGANTAGELSPRKAAELAAQKGLTIYTVGVGADEMDVPGLLGSSFGAYRKNPSKDLDEQLLKDIATLTRGRYFRARSAEDLLGIYQLLDQLEPVELETETFRPKQALYFWPLGFALLLSLMMALLSIAPTTRNPLDALRDRVQSGATRNGETNNEATR